jgi:hypothetical protein
MFSPFSGPRSFRQRALDSQRELPFRLLFPVTDPQDADPRGFEPRQDCRLRPLRLFRHRLLRNQGAKFACSLASQGETSLRKSQAHWEADVLLNLRTGLVLVMVPSARYRPPRSRPRPLPSCILRRRRAARRFRSRTLREARSPAKSGRSVQAPRRDDARRRMDRGGCRPSDGGRAPGDRVQGGHCS